ncbi:MAG: cobalamin B12-binding domain-containing protein [Planctomycetota bacterium]|jgi:methylmalonyl-CoA mutase C-terminal domain/subunit
MGQNGKIKVLVAKPGLDGHDVGAKVVVRALMDAGFAVVYTGLKKSPEEIVHRARQEKVDVLGLSILSGSHLPLCRRIKELLSESGQEGILWLVGGNIPAKDHDDLKALGVASVFGVGSSPESIVSFIRQRLP